MEFRPWHGVKHLLCMIDSKNIGIALSMTVNAGAAFSTLSIIRNAAGRFQGTSGNAGAALSVLRNSGFQGFVGAELIYFRHCHGATLSILSCSTVFQILLVFHEPLQKLLVQHFKFQKLHGLHKPY
jgi:hypothetical protein